MRYVLSALATYEIPAIPAPTAAAAAHPQHTRTSAAAHVRAIKLEKLR